LHEYQFTDPDLSESDGPVRYRIRQLLDTAASTLTAFYMDTVTLSLALACTPVPTSENGIQIIPNPVQNSFTVKMQTASAIDNLQVFITNTVGQRVKEQRLTKAAGIHLFPIQTTGLSRGLYYLVVYNNGKRLATRPFIKL
jgi:serine protease AprX